MGIKINWKEIVDEAANLLSQYIQINTTNPPGNEEEAVEFLAGILKNEGFQPEILGSGNQRSNILCKIRGSTSASPLLLLSHIDVVGAVGRDWEIPPFSGAIRNGYVWGRGAIDCKGLGIMELMSLLMLRRMGIMPKRDLILLAVADEESGGESGAKWITENHWDKISAGFVLNEGGEGISGMFGKDIMKLCFGEKGPLWLKLKAKGKSGHGSIPIQENPNDKIVAALAGIASHETAVNLLPEIKSFLRGLGRSMGLPLSIFAPFAANNFVLNLFRKKLKGIKDLNPILRNTISITNIKSGFKENVIPSEAEAVLDCRLLPGQDKGEFLNELKGIIGNPEIEIEVLQSHPASQSSAANEFMDVLKRVVQQNNPGALFFPLLSPGFTDSRFFRERGAVSYGFIPCLFTREEIDTIHGINERISFRCLGDGIRNIFDLCREF